MFLRHAAGSSEHSFVNLVGLRRAGEDGLPKIPQESTLWF